MNDSIMRTRPLLARVFLDYNPFYLLSALCMLAGLFSLNDSLNWSPLPEHNLLWLILILNVYEFMLIGLGVFLARRKLMRDAATLFVLEAFFLADAGFLNSEIFTVDFQLGLAVNIVLLMLAAAKVAVVFRGFRIPLSDARYPLILAQMLILLAMPGVLKQVSESHNATLPALAVFGAWWVVGLIPILYLLMLRNMTVYPYRGIIGAFMALPLISIIAHLGTSNWVYHVQWYSANLAPVMLGLAVAIGASDRHVTSIAARMRLQLLLPAFAILLAGPEHRALLFFVGDAMMTPMRLALLAAFFVYLHGLLLHRHAYFAIAGAMCLGAAGLGESPTSMAVNVTVASRTTTNTIWGFIPRTVMGWGIVSVAASFVLLGFGLLVSLLKKPHQEVEQSAFESSDIA